MVAALAEHLKSRSFLWRGLVLKRMGLLKESLDEFPQIIGRNTGLIQASEEKSILEGMLGMIEQ